jgi:MoxR-like ATPase
VLDSHRDGEPVDSLAPVLDCAQVTSLQEEVRKVEFEESIEEYLLDIVSATRESGELHLGVSTRGALALYRAAQALALVSGRRYVVPDDVKQLAVPVLAHRVIAKGYVHGGQRQAVESLIERLLAEVPAPE